MAGRDVAQVAAQVRAVAAGFAAERRERQQRRHLDPADFAALAAAGLPRLSVPRRYGGLWDSRTQSTRALADLFRVLGAADPSVALVASMHHAVLSTAGWQADEHAPAPYTDAWEEQKRWVFQSVEDGAWWGTIQSEPGSGGDLRKSQALARRGAGTGEYRLSGLKHFGSGTGVTAYMITQAIPEGEAEPDLFILAMRDVPLDGSQGVSLVAPWDGHGMPATQSHALEFLDFPARRSAWPAAARPPQEAAVAGSPVWPPIFVGIVDVAMATARDQLARRTNWSAFEEVEWTRAEMEAWLLTQAYAGMLSAIEANEATRLLAKLAIAELAESVLSRLCRVIGGGTYSQHSPFGCWLEDVRALGFLRPPWSLAYSSQAAQSRRALSAEGAPHGPGESRIAPGAPARQRHTAP
jgi:alkylation response protein AidB-like acyl-CoA dehydrogenase